MLERTILGLVCSITLSGGTDQGYNIAYIAQNPAKREECILNEENWRTLLRNYSERERILPNQKADKPHFGREKRQTRRYFRHK